MKYFLLLFIFICSITVFSQEAAQVKNSKAFIHADRDVDSKTIKWVGYGDRISISSEPMGEWYKVYLPNNQFGWILIDDVEFIPNLSHVKQCETIIQNLAPIRGLKLGMSKEEVLKIYSLDANSSPAARQAYLNRNVTLDAVKDVTVALDPYTFSNEQIPENYRDGVAVITVGFVEDKLAEFRISYDNTIQWVSADEFIAKLNNLYNFPKTIWANGRANCGNYDLYVLVNSSSTIGGTVIIAKSDEFIRYELKKSREIKQQKFKL